MRKSFNHSIAGCVLSGGQSKRMKTDKALLELDGVPLISIALERLRGFSEVLISAAEAEKYAFTGAKIITDERPGMGPLSGLISVLKNAESSYVCFRPVDAPLVPASLHHIIAQACFGKDAAIPVFTNNAEPLLACYSKTALHIFETLAEKGNYKISDALSLIDSAYVSLDSPEISATLGDPRLYLANANDPHAFQNLKTKYT